MEINPSLVAEKFRAEIKDRLVSFAPPVKLVGLLASSDASSHTYSQYMKVGCNKVGVEYEEITMESSLIEQEILRLNEDSQVTGVIVYYPIFGGEKDRRLRDLLSPYKDVEGLHSFWLQKLYSNDRKFKKNGIEVKSVLPCTPLAIVKVLDYVGMFIEGPKCLTGKLITIFNRSEVVGQPLAHMLSNDGARVFSFDINGVVEFNLDSPPKETKISREEALRNSNIVITGVPTSSFKKVELGELKENVCCVNFSSVENFSPEVCQSVPIYVPRVGPVTVTMCLRNLLRMAEHFTD